MICSSYGLFWRFLLVHTKKFKFKDFILEFHFYGRILSLRYERKLENYSFLKIPCLTFKFDMKFLFSWSKYIRTTEFHLWLSFFCESVYLNYDIHKWSSNLKHRDFNSHLRDKIADFLRNSLLQWNFDMKFGISGPK